LKTDQLVAELVPAGRTLTLPDETGAGGVNWRQRAYAAQRHSKVPAGKRLRVARHDDSLVTTLEEGATGSELGAEPVVVPTRVRRYHPVVRDYRERTWLHEVSRKGLPRAARIVHALALAVLP